MIVAIVGHRRDLPRVTELRMEMIIVTRRRCHASNIGIVEVNDGGSARAQDVYQSLRGRSVIGWIVVGYRSLFPIFTDWTDIDLLAGTVALMSSRRRRKCSS